MSITSFDRPCSSLSRASLAGYELQTMLDKEVIYIKRCPKIWYEVEGENVCIGSEVENSCSSSTRTKSSSSKNSSRKSSTKEKYVIQKYSPTSSNTSNRKNKIIILNNRQNNYGIGTIKKKLFPHVSESSSYIFPTKQRASSSTSRLLDWFMSCCWRCSPGCQQLPTLNM